MKWEAVSSAKQEPLACTAAAQRSLLEGMHSPDQEGGLGLAQEGRVRELWRGLNGALPLISSWQVVKTVDPLYTWTFQNAVWY